MIREGKMRFGIVGAGMIAQTYVQAFRQNDAAVAVAVADPRREAAESVGRTLDCPAFDSFQALSGAVAIDALVVCTPPATHPEICIAAANRGLHVLCEKPLAIEREQAIEMFRAAKRNGVELMMASKFRYVADVSRARQLIAEGAIGNPVLFENVFTGRVDMTARWNSNPAMSGGGVLIDNGTHSVDIMRFFLGPLAELQVVEGKRLQTPAVEDTVRIFIRSCSDVIGSIDLSWTIDKGRPYFVSIYGSDGAIHVGWKESKYCRTSDGQAIVFGKGYDKVGAFGRQIDNFVGSIRRREPAVITPEDALASVEVIRAAYAAMRQSQWLPIPMDSAAKVSAIDGFLTSGGKA
jgi:predicted dehydrogenase